MPEPWNEIFQKITTNYRFVPLDREPLKAPVGTPEGLVWKDAATEGAMSDVRPPLSYSSPLAGGMSGIIRASWIARTPVLFGAQRVARPEALNRPVRLTEPQRLHNGPNAPYVIPGRALRGMIRQVLRIATKAKIGPFNDIRPARRDPDYQAARVGKDGSVMREPQSGWLILRGDGWVIASCDNMPEAYPPEILRLDLRRSHEGLNEHIRSTPRKRDTRTYGWPVFSGPFARKNSERAFGPPSGETIAVPHEAFLDFFDAYSRPGRGGLVPEGSLEVWAYEYAFQVSGSRRDAVLDAFNLTSLHGRRSLRPDNPPGIPVYYYYDGKDGLVIGMTQIMRFPYKRTVGEAVIAAQPQAGAKWLDWTEAMLGQVEKDGGLTSALKGRVSFGYAPCADAKLWQNGAYLEALQTQPRPGYFAFYLRREKSGGGPATYDLDNGIAAGRKRYPAWSETLSAPDQLKSWQIPADEQGGAPSGAQSYLQFLDEGTQFTGEIHFHNLLPEELGALLWALALGDERAFGHSGEARGSFCHSGGRARGFSFGSLWPAQIRLAHVDRNGSRDEPSINSDDAEAQDLCGECLREFAKAAYGLETLEKLNQVPALARLRRFCDPQRSGVPMGLGLRRFPTKDVFNEYIALRREIETPSNPKVREVLDAPAASEGFSGNILDFGSDP